MRHNSLYNPNLVFKSIINMIKDYGFFQPEFIFETFYAGNLMGKTSAINVRDTTFFLIR